MEDKVNELKLLIEEAERYSVNSNGERFKALVYTDDIREIFGWEED